METLNIYGAEDLDKRYFARCFRRLGEWSIPLYCWECIDVREVL